MPGACMGSYHIRLPHTFKGYQMKSFLPALFIIVIFLCISLSSSCQMTRKTISPATGQTGMFSYRNASLAGYNYYDNKGNLKKEIIITRNTQGRIIEKEHFDAAGNLMKKFIYEYDKAARLSRKSKLSPDGKYIRDNLYSYDINGHLKKQQVLGQDRQLLKTHIYVFNHNDERIQKTTWDKKNNLKKTKLYLYDSKEKRSRDYTISADGDILSVTRYKYNNSDDISNITYTDSQGKKKGHAVITYDSQNRRLKKKRFDAQNNLSSTLHHLYN